MDEDKGKVSLSIKDLTETTSKTAQDIKRMNEALNNMKIGGEFIEMMEKIDVHKICMMENSIEALKGEIGRIAKDLEMSRK